MTKLEQAARQALGALVRAEALYGQPNADIQTAIREALAEQEKQEPVALDEVRRIAAEYAEPNSQVDSGNLYWALCEALKYTAPVDAKAIRSEALEEAAKVCRTAQAQGLQSIREAIEAAIRGLK